jgi:hypothetical protein
LISKLKMAKVERNRQFISWVPQYSVWPSIEPVLTFSFLVPAIYWPLYSVVAGMVTRNSLLLAPSRNCMTHHQALQDFSDTSQVSLHKNNKINVPVL